MWIHDESEGMISSSRKECNEAGSFDLACEINKYTLLRAHKEINTRTGDHNFFKYSVNIAI